MNIIDLNFKKMARKNNIDFENLIGKMVYFKGGYGKVKDLWSRYVLVEIEESDKYTSGITIPYDKDDIWI